MYTPAVIDGIAIIALYGALCVFEGEKEWLFGF